MPRGHVDFGQNAQTAIIGTMADMGELAARLGSQSVYNRMGNLLFQDGFENGLSAWMIQTSGVGAGVVVDNNIAFQGLASCVLTAGSDASVYAGILKRVQPIVLTRLGIEMTFSFETATDRIYFGLQYNTGVYKYKFNVRFEEDNNQITYRDNNGVYQQLTAYTFTPDDAYMYHTVKLVIDLDKLSYDKLYVNYSRYDMTAYAAQETADTTQPRLECNIGNTGRAGNNDIMRLDNVVLTINEP